ncbi:hypothetical protein V8F33_008040 [Rhypophila sp. PSN 637]
MTKNTIITRLQKHAGEYFTDLPELKGFILCAHYFSLPNHRGGVAEPAKQFVTQNGGVITFNKVPVYTFVDAIEREIEKRIPSDRRTEIYHKVLKGMPGYKAVPDWDAPSKESMYTEPLTPFSMPRDDNISNQDLLDALAPAAEITLSSAGGIGTQIAWWDAMSNGKFCAGMSFGGGVDGGRLGRDHKHTISDVPRNYFRDRLMDYINVEVDGPEELSKLPAKPSALISLMARSKSTPVSLPKTGNRWMRRQRQDRARHIMERHEVSTLAQAKKIVLMNDAIKNIDDSIDWQTPKPMGIRRPRWGKKVTGSVVIPHIAAMRCEYDVDLDDEVDRDCDQVRAMIKKFVTGFWVGWDAELFRIALADNMTRDKFTTFLNKRGTDDTQKGSDAYLLSWEFFNRRQKLGLSVEDPDRHIDMDIIRKREDDARRTDRERAMVKVHEDERKPLEDKHDNETAVLRKKHEEQYDALKKVHVEQLKALADAHPWGTPGHSEKLRELAAKQDKESEARNKKRREKENALHDAQYEESKALDDQHEKQLDDLKEEERLEALREKEQVRALAVARPGRLNTRKRASGGASRAGGKRARK